MRRGVLYDGCPPARKDIGAREENGNLPKLKLKTRKTAAKRFSVSGTGKLMRFTTGMNHLKSGKSSARKRRLSIKQSVGEERKAVSRLIGGV